MPYNRVALLVIVVVVVVVVDHLLQEFLNLLKSPSNVTQL
jgi:hypothetical protein